MEHPEAGSLPATQDQALESGGAAERRGADVGAIASPRLVIRGESSDEDTNSYGGERVEIWAVRGRAQPIAIPAPFTSAHPLSALTDYLNITFPFTEDRLPSFVADWRRFLGDSFGALSERSRGLHGYRRSFLFDHGSVLVAVGGQRGTGFVSLPGEGCARVPCWESARTFFADVLKGRITRWDGAVDDFDGVHGVDLAVEWWRAGKFNAGGNRPSCSQYGNWIEPDGHGRTFYVGRRTNGKLMRIYEKGKQLGDPNSPWVRWELELHNIDRVIPFDVLTAPGQYVAGAYPCMRWVREEASRIRTHRKSVEIVYEYLVRCAQTGYGRLINVMLEREPSVEAVVEKLVRPGVPSRLAISSDEDGAAMERASVPTESGNDGAV